MPRLEAEDELEGKKLKAKEQFLVLKGEVAKR
jgi:hypothetical protein